MTTQSDPEKEMSGNGPLQQNAKARTSEDGSFPDKTSLHRSTSSSSSSSNNTTTTQPPTRSVRSASLARSGLSRTVSEVRDGILNQRELGDERDEEAGEADGEKGGRQEEAGNERDENLVDWEGPADPLNPKNWPRKKKWAAVITVSFFTLISPVSSTMAAPALPNIGASLHITSELELVLTLSIFVAAYALGPLVWGPLSELHGRVPILQISNLWFLLFNLGCALAKTKTQMIVLRFFAGIGGSAPMACGGGVLADLFRPEERGRAISVYSVAPLLGPALGPIAGGWIAQLTTWRWVFYSTTIVCGLIQTLAWFFLHETYAPILLSRKKKRLIKETGNTNLHTEHDHPDRTHLRTLVIALTRPFRLLFTQPILVFLALYMTYLYGSMYLVLATFPTLFSTVYHESPGIQGLNYISLGLGFFLGTQICAPLQDRIYKGLKRRRGIPDREPGVPEFRVPMMIPGAILVPSGLLIYAWTADAHTHWIAPNIGACIYASGVIIGFQCIQGYLVDTYAKFAASAIGAATVMRSLAGFGFPLFAHEMYDQLGYGWGGTLLAGMAVVLGWPAPAVLWVYGAKMRAASKFAR